MANKKICSELNFNIGNLNFEVIEKFQKKYPNFHKYENFVSVIIKHNLTNDLDINAIRLDLSRIFEKIFDYLTKDVGSEDFIYIEISNPNIDNPICITPMKKQNFKASKVFDKFYQYVQSFREFFASNTFDIIVNVTEKIVGYGKKYRFKSPKTIDLLSTNKKSIVVIKNFDNSCGLRAFFVAKYHQDNKHNLNKKEWIKIVHNSYNIQYKEAEKIAINVGLDINNPIGSDQWQILQNYFNEYQIVVIDSSINLKAKQFIYRGPSNTKHIYVQYIHGHYNAIVNIRGFLGTNYFCEECFKGYYHITDHICKEKCKLCFGKCEMDKNNKIKCNICNLEYLGNNCFENHLSHLCKNVRICKECDDPVYKRQRHVCGENFYCERCNAVFPYNFHHCMINPLEKNKTIEADLRNKIIVAFDIESIISNDNHIANLLVYKTVCDKCYDKTDCNICHQNNGTLFGFDCIKLFVDYLFFNLAKIAEENNSTIYAFAHNCRAYDGQFILREIWNRKFDEPDIIMRGRKILKIEIGNVKILDSLNFFLQPLEKLPKALGLDDTMMKGLFPFLFNKEENYSYSGAIPDKFYFGYDYMTEEKQKKFNEWHKSFIESKKEWNFKNELIKYCQNDVDILLKCIIKFRIEFKKITNIDPITRSITLASVGLEVFRFNYLLENQLAKSPNKTYSNKYSFNSNIGNAWLDYLEKFHGLELHREYKIHKYYVDGYDSKTKTIYEFNGCNWHGHDCTDKNYNLLKLNETLTRKKFLEKKGYQVVEIWSCQYKILKQDIEVKKYLNMREKYYAEMNKIGWLDIRNSFFGGRTDNERYYYEAEKNEKIRIVDFCSEYPYVLKNCEFPIGVPQSIKENFDYSLKNYFGFIKCKILPPTSLRIPVLPVKIIQHDKSIGEDGNINFRKIGEKLVFPLCENCAKFKLKTCECPDRSLSGTWTTVEVKKALELGYKMIEIYEVLHYNENQRSKDIFKKYIDLWLKIKQEASGWPNWCKTEEDKYKYIEDYEKVENIRLDYNKICKNEALRYIAKIMLNSFWGKLAQKPNQPKKNFFHSYDKYWQLLNDDKKIVESEIMLNEETLLATWKLVEEDLDTHTNFNVAVASYVTAWGRLKLYDVLLERDNIRPNCILYYDTDSVYFIEKIGDPLIKCGNFLGDLTDEVSSKYGEGSNCIKFVSIGPKNYAYVIEKSNGEIITEYKCKGISLSAKTSNIINFKNIVNMAIQKQINNESTPMLVPQYRFKIDREAQISTEYFEKIYKATGDKRNILFKNNEYITVPWGYKTP